MEISKPLPDDDVLSEPIRARLFTVLTRLRRPASTQELAQLAGRHPNTVRVQLQRLADAGLIECRQQRQARGRPKHSWAILPGARPGGEAPEAHGQLSRWLARAMAGGHELPAVEAAGREIGHELAPEPSGRGVREAMHDALTALGFAPHSEPSGDNGTCYVLGNCPYRDAVAENPSVICTLHRGITQGLLDRLSPQTRLEAFVARDPFQAGCRVEIAPG
jgi:predicted ArsR family transcriptional regulator